MAKDKEIGALGPEDGEELYEHFRYEAHEGQVPLRVDKFLMNFIENATRNKIQAAAKAGNVWVNDQAVKPNYKVKPKDVVRVVLAHPPHENLLVAEDIPIHIVYEDDDLMVVNKEPGMVVHPGHGNYSGTLVNALIHHVENLPNNSSDRPGLVHRIDKDTSGLLVIAKNDFAMAHLSKQFFEKTTDREYLALVWGNVEEDKGRIEGHIARHVSNRLQMSVYEDGSQGKEAVTHYEVLERLGYVTLVKCVLETGRTHQIRVHMKYIGHTLFNDARYGGDQILKGTTFSKYKRFVENCFEICPRQALHAKTLGFVHPKTGKYMHFDSELPNDMESLLDKWRHYGKYKQSEEE